METAVRAPVAPYQPRLRWWSHLWRDLVVAIVSLVAWVDVAYRDPGRSPALAWTDIALGVAAFAVVHLRRRNPLAVALLITAFGPFSSLASGPALLAMVSVTTGRRWWQIVVVGVANALSTVLYYWIQPTADDPWWLTGTLTVASLAAVVAWGLYIGSRRELLWTLRQRAEQAEAERDLRAAQARTTERARIAREMHDVLAHRITQISLQAGALAFREDLGADELREGVGAIRERSHEALQDLREVLGVLRADSAGLMPVGLTAPQPTYTDIVALVDDVRAAGTEVRLEERLAPGAEVPLAVGRTVYRVVQEGLTNAGKHAPAATVDILVEGGPAEGLTVRLSNALGFGPSLTPGSGLGLVGLAERAELRGGRLHHGVEQQAGGLRRFVLRVWLPWSGDAEQAPDPSGGMTAAVPS